MDCKYFEELFRPVSLEEVKAKADERQRLMDDLRKALECSEKPEPSDG